MLVHCDIFFSLIIATSLKWQILKNEPSNNNVNDWTKYRMWSEKFFKRWSFAQVFFSLSYHFPLLTVQKNWNV
jgi:hypothetical protein